MGCSYRPVQHGLLCAWLWAQLGSYIVLRHEHWPQGMILAAKILGIAGVRFMTDENLRKNAKAGMEEAAWRQDVQDPGATRYQETASAVW